MTQLGPYTVIRKLAVGGMGEVYFARHTETQLPAVIKTTRGGGPNEANNLQMFFDEARIALQLDHPNIVKIHELGDDQGTHYIAMEYVDGESISGLLIAAKERRRHLPWPFISAVAQAARGMHYAHHAVNAQRQPLKLVHRDISPQNIMVGRDGVARVVDFGIAKVADSQAFTQTGGVRGKVAYMAPEQLLGKNIDARTDLFALGIVLLECMTYHRLYGDKTDMQVMMTMAQGQRPNLAELTKGLHRGLEAIIHRALEWEPNARFQTGNEMADALESFLNKLPTSERQPLGSYVQNLVGDKLDQRISDHEVEQAESNPRATPMQSGSLPPIPQGMVVEGQVAAGSPSGLAPRPSASGVSRPAGSGISRASQSVLTVVPAEATAPSAGVPPWVFGVLVALVLALGAYVVLGNKRGGGGAVGLVSLLPAQSSWNYFDEADVDAKWFEAGFDDSDWKIGRAPLGYGDDQRTITNYGPSDSNKRMTTYFRSSFTTTRSFSRITVRVMRDDGAIVYINGNEIWRNNMPSGRVTPETKAIEAIGGADETTFQAFDIDPKVVLPGRNMIAVEMHQAAPTSTDLSFDLEVLASE